VKGIWKNNGLAVSWEKERNEDQPFKSLLGEENKLDSQPSLKSMYVEAYLLSSPTPMLCQRKPL
jgi:hypothetical protein